MRISDWSSDVCSSDLVAWRNGGACAKAARIRHVRCGSQGGSGRAPRAWSQPVGNRWEGLWNDYRIQIFTRDDKGQDKMGTRVLDQLYTQTARRRAGNPPCLEGAAR